MSTTLEYMQLATRVYTASELNRIGLPDGWTQLDWVPDLSSGFSAGTYKNEQTNEIVISFAGTNEAMDVLNWSSATGTATQQILDAISYYLEFRKAHPEVTNVTNITFTGHSLGGGLASLMAVFFDKQATVFDELPFQPAAISESVLSGAAETMDDAGYYDTNLANYIASSGGLVSMREQNVTHHYIEGEIANIIRSSWNTLVGDNADHSLSLGDSNAGIIDRHSMALLTALQASGSFLSVVRKLPDLVTELLDKDLFATNSQDQYKEDLLRKLLRHQFGVKDAVQPDGMLDRFTHDMEKIANTGDGLTLTTSLTKALIAFGMQAYYDDRLATGQELFTTDGVSGGIRFDRNNVSDTLENAKGYAKYFIDCLLTLPVTERATIMTQLPDLRDWFIQTGSQGMRATADDQRAFMLGGTGIDILTGSAQADLLIGGTGRDYLDGGAGDDTLIGGEGIDTYVISGHDRIIDTGRNNIIYNGQLLAGAFKFNSSSGVYEFISDDGGYQLQFHSPGQLTLSAEDSVTFVNQTSATAFADNDFGIKLLDGPAAAQVIVPPGDGNANMLFDASALSKDVRGNGGRDMVFGGIGNDLLDGGEGDDWIAGRGGADSINGGAGNDLITWIGGGSLVEGGDGNDLLMASVREWFYVDNPTSPFTKDAIWADVSQHWQAGTGEGVLINTEGYLYVRWWGGVKRNASYSGASVLGGGWTYEFSIDADDAISITYYHPTHAADGVRPADYWEHMIVPEPLSTHGVVLLGGGGNDLLVGNGGADCLSGGGGKDYLIGNSGDDILSGGEEDDTLVGGKGDDTLQGGGGSDEMHGETGADTIFGEDGDDHIWADSQSSLLTSLDGDDYADGGLGNDQIIGQGGNDTIYGGIGNDVLYGDDASGQQNGKDFLHGDAGDDFLVGGRGDDVLRGGSGSDYLEGGLGNDQLDGGDDNDAYIFNDGDGADTVSDSLGVNEIHFANVSDISSLIIQYASIGANGA